MFNFWKVQNKTFKNKEEFKISRKDSLNQTHMLMYSQIQNLIIHNKSSISSDL